MASIRKRPHGKGSTSAGKDRNGSRVELWQHQREGVRYCRRSTHAAVFMEMRLGKVRVMIRWAQSERLRRCLVVAPMNVLEAWERDLDAEGEDFVLCANKSEAKRLQCLMEAWEHPGRCWLLMNYDCLLAMAPHKEVKYGSGTRRVYQVPLPGEMPWDLVVLDESTKIKNPESHISRICHAGFRKAEHRAILSGLPSPEGLHELFSQFVFLRGSFLGETSYYRFLNKHFYHDERNKLRPYSKSRKLIDATLHTLAFIRTRAELDMEPKKDERTILVRLSLKQRRLYDEIEQWYAATLVDGRKIQTQWVLTARMWMRKLAGGFDAEEELLSSAKADAVLRSIQGEFSGQKVVVWFAFRHELEYFLERLDAEGIPSVSMMGGLSMKRRRERIQAFRGPSIRVMLATVDVAKFGNDYSVSDNEIYYSHNWGCEGFAQSKERIVHLNKVGKRTLRIRHVLSQGTIDEDIYYLLRWKLSNAQFTMQLNERILKRYGYGQNTQAKAASTAPGSRRTASNHQAGVSFPERGGPRIRRASMEGKHVRATS